MRARVSVTSLLFASVVFALGCTTYFPRNDPLGPWEPTHGYRASQVDQDDSNQVVFVLAFSGGGTRAAAFSFGVLEELGATTIEFDGRPRRMIDEIDTVSGVSGGSFTAAYLGLYGSRMLDTFPERFLHRNIQGALIWRLFWPVNWLKLFSPYWARSDLAADYYDSTVFDRAAFGDLLGRRTPFMQIHATDLTTGSPFAFTQEQFDYLCSDLSSFKIGRAVAASSAVPLLLSPISLRNYSGCGFVPPGWVREAGKGGGAVDRAYINAKNLLSYIQPGRRFVRLVDGGISDNLGVRGPFESWVHRVQDPPARRPDGMRVRSVVMLLVNAQTTPDAEWDQKGALPSPLSIVDATTSAQINRYNFETVELLRRTFRHWNERTTRWDPPLRYHVLEVGFLDVADEDTRKQLNRLGTSLTLSQDATDLLRRSAREALRGSAGYRALLEEIRGLDSR